ncbi:hypothetical protein I6G57_19985 [Burkholderia oklahomensis]|nr:hypothetical protein I6G57_19985 [Burkholderia oklahomensis]
MHLRFSAPDGSAMAFAPPPALSRSFIRLQSGDLKFYNLTLLNAKALIRPAGVFRCARVRDGQVSKPACIGRREDIGGRHARHSDGAIPALSRSPVRRSCARAVGDGAAASSAWRTAPLLRCTSVSYLRKRLS